MAERRNRKIKYPGYYFKNNGENDKQINKMVKRARIAVKVLAKEILVENSRTKEQGLLGKKCHDEWNRNMAMGRIKLNCT